MGSHSEAEHEFLKAVSLEPAAAAGWFSLGALYQEEDRIPDSIRAQQRGIDVSSSPQPRAILKLAHLYLETQQPRAALEAFDRALGSAPPDLLGESGPRSFRYDVAVGQASAWRSLGDTKRAAAFDHQAVRDLLPQN
jgi:tetratricopeptide (TPR) repeat protein